MPSFRGWVHQEVAKLTKSYDKATVDETFTTIRHHAEMRARQALLHGMGAVDRFNQDALFHHSINVIVQAAVAGVFGEFPLTDAEKEAKLQAFHVIMDKMPAWDAAIKAGIKNPSWTAAQSKPVTMDDIKMAAGQIKQAGYGPVTMGRAGKKPWPTKSGLPAAQDVKVQGMLQEAAEDAALASLAAKVERKSDELLGIKQKAKYEELVGVDPEDV